jgi:Flp pilus assembly protein TadG
MYMKLKKFLRDQSGVVVIEFAYAMPIFIGLGFAGIEVGYKASAAQRVSQIANAVADNLSRAKQSVPLQLPELREVDINDAFTGAQLQGGDFNILTNGRIIVSSLQQNATGGQWIAWQRCKGLKNVASAYGVEGTGKTVNTFQGMGPGVAADKVTAPAGAAIIFIEVQYDYKPILFESSSGPLAAKTFKEEMAFYVRDDRKMTGGPDGNGVFNPSPSVTAAKCNVFTAT